MLILNSGVKCFMSVLVKIRPRSFVLMAPYSLKYVANFIVKYSYCYDVSLFLSRTSLFVTGGSMWIVNHLRKDG